MHRWLPPAGVAADPRVIEGLVIGASAGCWAYPELQAPIAETDRRRRVERVTVLAADQDQTRRAFDAGVAISEGQAIAKRLGQMPGNYCTPETFVEVGRENGGRYGLQVTVLGRSEMEALGMGSFPPVAPGTRP